MVVLFSPPYNKEEQQSGQGLLRSLRITYPSCGNSLPARLWDVRQLGGAVPKGLGGGSFLRGNVV